MSKENSFSVSSVLQEMVHVGVYKRSQGRITRQVTLGVLGVSFLLSAWRLSAAMAAGSLQDYQWAVPLLLLVLGWWVSFRIINIPRFADFLIAVEAEMNKVSWPTRTELVRSSLVVIFVIFSLAGILFLFDMFWRFIFSSSVLGILQ